MNLRILLSQYIELFMLKVKEEAKVQKDSNSLHFLELELNIAYQNYIDCLFRSSEEDVKELYDYVESIIEKLNYEIDLLTKYQEVITNYDATQMMSMNYSLKYLVSKLVKYENIREGLKKIIGSKIYTKK